MKQVCRKTFIEEIIKCTKDLRIKSFHADNEVQDFQNIQKADYYLDKKIQISNKYIPILCETFELDFVLNNVVNKNKDFQLITNDLKFLSLNITYHAIKRFIKRYLYIYLNEQNNFEFSIEMQKIMNKNFDYILSLYLDTNLSEINKDVTIIKMVGSILKNVKVFNPDKNSGRYRDIWNFKMRINENKNTQMYFVHPFLFIVEDSAIKTIELYSSSYSMRNANKITGTDRQFKSYLMNKIKGK